MNKKLVALLMAGTISASALPFSALAAQPSNVSFTEIGAETDILGKKTNDFVSGSLTFNTSDTTINVSGTLKYVEGFTAFNTSVADQQEGYYLPFTIDVDKSVYTNAKVTLHSNIGGEKDMSNDLDALILIKDKNATPVSVTVDLDGDGEEYDATRYTLDYSNLELGLNSTAEFTKYAADEVVMDEKPASYFADDDINFAVDEASSTVKVTGSLNYVEGFTAFNEAVPEEQQGYYLPFKVNVEGESKNIKLKADTNNVDKDITDDPTVLALLPEDGSKTLQIIVDQDGAGKEYNETVYTLDYSEITFKKEASIAGFTAIDSAADLLGKTTADFVDGDLTFDVNAETNKIAVQGVLKYVEGFTAFNEAVPAEQEGNYLPFAVNVDTTAYPNAKIWLTGRGGKKDITSDPTALVILPEDPEKAVSVIVDLDGDGAKYEETTYTFDYSNLTLMNKELVADGNLGEGELAIDTSGAIANVSGSKIGNGLAAPSTVAEIKALFTNDNASLKMQHPDGIALTDDEKVYSGCEIVLLKADGTEAGKYTVIIPGAFTKSGVVEISDLTKLANAYVQDENVLNELETLIGDVNNNGEIDLADIVKAANTFVARPQN